MIDTSTGPAGGLATMVLADFGADVIKVEPPGGDRFRHLPGSPLWLRGKRSVVLDLHAADDLATLRRLVRGADVLVVAGPPGRAERSGVDAGAAEALQPRIVHCVITGWGETGPLAHLPGYVSTVAARAGRMMTFAQQIQRPGPVYAALPVAMHVAAHGAVQGIVSALFNRDRAGGMQRVTTSLLQGLLPFDLVELLLIQLTERWGVAPSPNPSTGPGMPTLNYHPVLTKDGVWIQCGNLLEHLFLSFLDAIDLYGELLADERFHDSPATWTPEAVEHARDRILETMQTRTADEWMAVFHANGNVAAEPFLTPAAALRHPDLVANGAIVEVDDPLHGRVSMIGPIATLSVTPADIHAAPTVGQHTAEIVEESRSLRAPIVSARSALSKTNAFFASGSADHGPKGQPLHGVTVVEFASVIAAPLGTSMLADLGARVIRVEPIEGDSFRHLLPYGLMTVKTTAGKESICVDLKREEGRSIARRLIAKADVLVHNYRLGVPERLGIGYEQLRAEHPRLIWVAVNGYGPNGPSAHRPATHPVAGAAMGGAGYQAGAALTAPCPTLGDVRESARQLLRANESNPDPNTSVIIASAVTLALLARQRGGGGQAVFVDMLTANAHANADAFLSYEGMIERPVVDAEHLGTGACHRLYQANSGWVFLAVTTDGEWRRFCAAIERPELGMDELFASVGTRETNGLALADILGTVFATRSAEEWEAFLGLQGIACVRADEATPGPFFAHHEQVQVNGFVPTVEHARFGELRRWGPIVQIDGGADVYGPGVLAGEHADALLAECGFSVGEIEALRAAGTVASEPTEPYAR